MHNKKWASQKEELKSSTPKVKIKLKSVNQGRWKCEVNQKATIVGVNSKTELKIQEGRYERLERQLYEGKRVYRLAIARLRNLITPNTEESFTK